MADAVTPALRPRPVRSAATLASRLAGPTLALRDRLLWLLGQPTEAGERARRHRAEWTDARTSDFAEGVAQALSWALAAAVLSRGRDPDADVLLSLIRSPGTAIPPTRSPHALLAPLLEPPIWTAIHGEVEPILALVRSVDPTALARGASGWDPTLTFHEDFLRAHDPAARRRAGVWSTPRPVVEAMVALVEQVLVRELGLQEGFAHPSVVTLDPATGTGTFPMAVLERSVVRMESLHGPPGRALAAARLARSFQGFELFPGPWALARMRLDGRLRELDPAGQLTSRVERMDALEAWTRQDPGPPVRGDRDPTVTVVLGNPPYRRGGRPGSLAPRMEALFDEVVDLARAQGHGLHVKNLYNQYAYFWRWALWRAFEQGEGPGVVALVTASSWLTGPAFAGLRELARRCCDQVYVLDLGGDQRGAGPEENVLAIHTPVAVVLGVREGPARPAVPATTRYLRISGTARDKGASLASLARSSQPLDGAWTLADNRWTAPLVPQAGGHGPRGHGGDGWHDHPLLADLFPWQHSGVQFKRTWTREGSEETLQARVRALQEASPQDRPGLFRDTGSRTAQAFLGTLAGAPAPTAPYGFRSFDRQWCIALEEAADRFRPSLWRCRSDRQIYLVAPMTKAVSRGPCMVATAAVPDLDHFRGSFGARDVLPLYRDPAAARPNLPRGLPEALGQAHGTAPPTPEDLAAYVYALLSAPAYQARFATALSTPGPRVPVTADGDLWQEAVALGTRLLWLHTFCERLQGPGRGAQVPQVPGLAWARPVRSLPPSPADLLYDRATGVLELGGGALAGVRPEVWEYEVSGMPVVRKWLSWRTARGAGRAVSSGTPLDRIRPTSWPERWSQDLLELVGVLSHTLDAHPAQEDLLERICAGPTLSPSLLPGAGPGDRKPLGSP